MTGMKEGAGEDPFAEDDDSVPAESSTPAETGGDPRKESDPTDDADAESTATTAESTPEMTHSPESTQSQTQYRIPYKFRRDGVQDGRDRVPLFLHSETKRAERDALHELEDRFNGDVSLTDLREALVMVGLEHLDEVEGQLETWGYGMTFDE